MTVLPCGGPSAAPRASNAERDQDVDLVILDVMMPELDGLAVYCELKPNPPVSTGYPADRQGRCLHAREAMTLGVSEFPAKPVNIEDFLTRVRTQC